MSDLETRRTEIADRLRAAREQAGLSQGQVATLLKLQRPAVSEIEAGRRRVTAEEIAQLAEIFDVNVEWIISGTATMADPKVELAARELGKLKSDDLDMVLKLLRTMKRK
ncbi:helix-turn-helix transcriptional regulator [Opitutus sp. GAS368]|uniref:helix-turn-helix domain-containing protein n=1 Tax=Opitutus sp. GAS368 TaxID=1882749 RepID=UPI00087DCED9|nr:helix-turn-helix transcriptional regulator [Opitutus sp. GAS368]SDS02290.1 Helix-turn-helix domain-containing protein [Opitutus sp. GAS368]